MLNFHPMKLSVTSLLHNLVICQYETVFIIYITMAPDNNKYHTEYTVYICVRVAKNVLASLIYLLINIDKLIIHL